MRIAKVIGTVTLNQVHPALVGKRWIVGVPFSLKALQEETSPDGEPWIILDELGAGTGNQIAVSEGVEASTPFYPEKKPVDAYCALILDSLNLAKP